MTAATTKHEKPDETRDALRRLLVVASTLVACVAVTYFVPAWRAYRPFERGDSAPVVRHFLENTGAVERVATGGASTTTRARPVATAHGGAQPVVARPVGPRTHVEPSEYAGLDVHLVDEGDRGMRPFYDALRRTAEEQPGALTRIAHYGDSSIALDSITSTVRRNLQQRFGDGGHGFVLIAKGYMAYRHEGLYHYANDAWQVQEITRRARADGRYGFGGITLRGGGGARAAFGSETDGPVGRTVSRFELWHATGPRLGAVELRLDRGPPQVVSTTSPELGEDVHVVTTNDGDHRLELRALSSVELYGMVLEREGPGVVYDSLGLVGARANRLLNFDAEHIRTQLARRGTNLLVLGFGGNEASDAIDPARYEAEFERVVARMRGERPELGCLIVTPLDQAERVGGAIRTFRGLPRIVEAQRRVAARTGCAFFDVFGAMGGEGSMGRWFRSSPRLASGDFRHATPQGYEVVGNMIYRAILEGFARHLAQSAAAR